MNMKSVTEKRIEFEQPKPYGWTTVLFPEIHDESCNLEEWMRLAFLWIKERRIRSYTWGFVHGKKKDGDRISPVFFFKGDMDGYAMMWRFKGEISL